MQMKFGKREKSILTVKKEGRCFGLRSVNDRCQIRAYDRFEVLVEQDMKLCGGMQQSISNRVTRKASEASVELEDSMLEDQMLI